MCAIQMIGAQVRRVSGKGLADNMRHYPAPVIYPLICHKTERREGSDI